MRRPQPVPEGFVRMGFLVRRARILELLYSAGLHGRMADAFLDVVMVGSTQRPSLSPGDVMVRPYRPRLP